MFSLNADCLSVICYKCDLKVALRHHVYKVSFLTCIFSAQQTSATPNRVQQKPRETIFLPATVPEFLYLLPGSRQSGLITRFHEQSRHLPSRFCSCHVVIVMGPVKFVISSVHICSRGFRLEGHVARKEVREEGREMRTTFRWEIKKEIHSLEDVCVNRSIILKRILKEL